MSKPCCFLDISIGNEQVGRIIIELLNDQCPKATENFRKLCQGMSGVGMKTGKPLHFKGSKFQRVIRGFILQGGGSGSESVFGGTFADECLTTPHDKPFLLSMVNRGPDTNGSQFFITTAAAPHLDGKHVVFGHVITGQDVVRRMEAVSVEERTYRPTVSVVVVNCGELMSVKEISSEEESADSSESERVSKKKKKRQKHKKKKSKKRRIDEKDDTGKIDSAEPTARSGKQDAGDATKKLAGEKATMLSTFRPEEIPDILTPRFLYRRSPSPAKKPSGDQQAAAPAQQRKVAPVEKTRCAHSSSSSEDQQRCVREASSDSDVPPPAHTTAAVARARSSDSCSTSKNDKKSAGPKPKPKKRHRDRESSSPKRRHRDRESNSSTGQNHPSQSTSSASGRPLVGSAQPLVDPNSIPLPPAPLPANASSVTQQGTIPAMLPSGIRMTIKKKSVLALTHADDQAPTVAAAVTSVSTVKDKVTSHQLQESAVSDECQRENESLREAVLRLNKEKKELAKEKDELAVQVSACKRENRQQGELIVALKSDKDHLERDIKDARQLIGRMEGRKDLLYGDELEALPKRETLLAELSRQRQDHEVELENANRQREQLQLRLQQTEKDLQKALQQEQQPYDEFIDRLTVEKENNRDQTNLDKDELAQKIAIIQRERDNALLSESKKQQALALVEQEKSVLEEKLGAVQAALQNLEGELDRVRKEVGSRQLQDKLIIDDLNQELRNFKKQCEEASETHAAEAKESSRQLQELTASREQTLREMSELKVQLKMAEETRDNLRRDLTEANRKGDESREHRRYEIHELKRALEEEQREKKVVEGHHEDMVRKVKEMEDERLEQNRLLAEQKEKQTAVEEEQAAAQEEAVKLRTNVRDLEKARLENLLELHELRRQLKEETSERDRLTEELGGLKTRMATDDEKEKEHERENLALKLRMVENDKARDVLRKELDSAIRRIQSLQETVDSKNRDYLAAVEQACREQRKLVDIRAHLLPALETAKTYVDELKLALNTAEGRINTLEAQLARVEGAKRDVEYKLASIHSSLGRLLGYRKQVAIGQSLRRSRSSSCSQMRRSPGRPDSPTKGLDNTHATTTDGRGSPIPRTRPRSLSPSVRQHDDGDLHPTDINPEAVRLALREFDQQLITAERERDATVAQARSLECRLKEQAEQTEQAERRFQQLQQALGKEEGGDEKDVDSRLSSAQTALLLQEEALRLNERERKVLGDKISDLERQLASSDSEKRQLQKTIFNLKQSEVQLGDAESRVTQLELARRLLDEELEGLKMTLIEKKTENQALQKKIDSLYEKIEEEESAHTDKVQQLSNNLSDQAQMIKQLEDRNSDLQKAVASSETTLQEQLDSTQSALNEVKQQNQELLDRVQSLQKALTDSELRWAELESANRESKSLIVKHQKDEQEMYNKLSKATREKHELTERVASLQRTVTDRDMEIREFLHKQALIEKDYHSLKKMVDKVDRERIRAKEKVHISEEARRRLKKEKDSLQKMVHCLQTYAGRKSPSHSASRSPPPVAPASQAVNRTSRRTEVTTTASTSKQRSPSRSGSRSKSDSSHSRSRSGSFSRSRSRSRSKRDRSRSVSRSRSRSGSFSHSRDSAEPTAKSGKQDTGDSTKKQAEENEDLFLTIRPIEIPDISPPRMLHRRSPPSARKPAGDQQAAAPESGHQQHQRKPTPAEKSRHGRSSSWSDESKRSGREASSDIGGPLPAPTTPAARRGRSSSNSSSNSSSASSSSSDNSQSTSLNPKRRQQDKVSPSKRRYRDRESSGSTVQNRPSQSAASASRGRSAGSLQPPSPVYVVDPESIPLPPAPESSTRVVKRKGRGPAAGRTPVIPPSSIPMPMKKKKKKHAFGVGRNADDQAPTATATGTKGYSGRKSPIQYVSRTPPPPRPAPQTLTATGASRQRSASHSGSGSRSDSSGSRSRSGSFSRSRSRSRSRRYRTRSMSRSSSRSYSRSKWHMRRDGMLYRRFLGADNIVPVMATPVPRPPFRPGPPYQHPHAAGRGAAMVPTHQHYHHRDRTVYPWTKHRSRSYSGSGSGSGSDGPCFPKPPTSRLPEDENVREDPRSGERPPTSGQHHRRRGSGAQSRSRSYSRSSLSYSRSRSGSGSPGSGSRSRSRSRRPHHRYRFKSRSRSRSRHVLNLQGYSAASYPLPRRPYGLGYATRFRRNPYRSVGFRCPDSPAHPEGMVAAAP